ncbi:MAG: hypothetical protein R3A46_09535 [Thermomicrobiales bacterium]
MIARQPKQAIFRQSRVAARFAAGPLARSGAIAIVSVAAEAVPASSA